MAKNEQRGKIEKTDAEQVVARFEKHEGQLHVYLREIQTLSNKKPHDAVNKFKLQFINATVAALNAVLGNEKPLAEFTIFDVDSLPSNSDVAMILSQYAATVYEYRKSRTRRDTYSGSWFWYSGTDQIAATGEPGSYRYRGI